jgi:hypothetical protein
MNYNFKIYNKNRTLTFNYKNNYFNLKRNLNHLFIIKKDDLTYITNKYKTIFYENIIQNDNHYLLYIIHKKSNLYNDIIDNKYINVILMKNNEILYHNKFIHYNNIDIHYNLFFNTYLNELKVISILDPFSNTIFSKEFKNYPLNPILWFNQFQKIKPDLFLVESVWNSINSKFNFSYPNNIDLIKNILHYCNLNKIKVLFWNKEDGINYDKFIWIAKLFPNISTTDNTCISKYLFDCNHKNIFVLPFGITPILHNPFNKGYINPSDILFAGRWYYGNEFSDRIKDMKILFQDFQLFKNKNLVIFDRNYNKLFGKKSFPDLFLPYLHESVDYETICLYYRHFKILYNVNSVHNSDTMFSRRVLEAIGCKTFVVSSYSKALQNFHLNSIYLCFNNNDTKKYTNLILNHYDKILINIHNDFINVYLNHTITNKLENIFYNIKLPFDIYQNKVFLIYLNDQPIINQSYKNCFHIFLIKDSTYYISCLNHSSFQIHYSNATQLFHLFENSILFFINNSIQYYKHFIKHYLLHYKYLTHNINFNNTIISKASDENNSNKFNTQFINGTLSTYFNENNFNHVLNNNFETIKFYNIDCYDFNYT